MKHLAPILAASLFGFALVETGLFFWSSHRAPAFDDWYAVKPLVEAAKHAGDVVVIAPAWADPLARRAFGDALMPMEDGARADVSRYAGAIEVSILGAHSEELAAFHEVSSQTQGKFTVRRLENGHHEPVIYDFVANLGPDHAHVFTTEPAAECPFYANAQVVAGGLGGPPTFPRARFQCAAGSFFFAGVTILADEDFKPKRCIWSHPMREGELVTRFSHVPLGKVIRGHGGLYWITERERAGAPVELAVRVDGDTIGTFVHHDGDGFSGFEFPLGSHAGARAEKVEFAVRSSNYLHRHFCWEATTR